MPGPSGFCLWLESDCSTSLWGQEVIRQERGASRQSLLFNSQGFGATARVPALEDGAHRLLRGLVACSRCAALAGPRACAWP